MYDITVLWTKIQEVDVYSNPLSRPISVSNSHNENLWTTCWKWVGRWLASEIQRKIKARLSLWRPLRPLVNFPTFCLFSFSIQWELELTRRFSSSFSHTTITQRALTKCCKGSAAVVEATWRWEPSGGSTFPAAGGGWHLGTQFDKQCSRQWEETANIHQFR